MLDVYMFDSTDIQWNDTIWEVVESNINRLRSPKNSDISLISSKSDDTVIRSFVFPQHVRRAASIYDSSWIVIYPNCLKTNHSRRIVYEKWGNVSVDWNTFNRMIDYIESHPKYLIILNNHIHAHRLCDSMFLYKM